MADPLAYDLEVLEWARDVLRDDARWAPWLLLDADLAQPKAEAVTIAPEAVDGVLAVHSYPAIRLDIIDNDDRGGASAGDQRTLHKLQVRAFVRARKRAHARDPSVAPQVRAKAARLMRVTYLLLERAGMEPAAPGYNVEPQTGLQRALVDSGGPASLRVIRTMGIWQITESGRGRLAIPSP